MNNSIELELNKINVKNLVLNENAYFFKKSQSLDNRDIKNFFKESIAAKKAKSKYKPIVKESFFDNEGIEIALYSLDIFEYQSKPTFLKQSDKNLVEKKFGLFLIVETDEYIGLIRKNVSGIKTFKDFAESIDYEVLSRFLISEKSKFEKIESSSINTSEASLQRKISEAKDLQGVYSRFASSKEILNSVRIDDSKSKHSIALNTSRVNSFNLKSDFDSIVYWIVFTLDLIERAYVSLPKSTFLDGFAKPIKFETVIETIKPTYLLIRFAGLLDEIDSGNIARAFLTDKGEEKEMDLKRLISENQELIEVTQTDDNKKYEAEDITLKINANHISLSSKNFAKIYIEFENGYNTTLSRYLNSGNHFIINFDKIEFVYSNRKIFKDSRLFGNLDHFFETFIPRPELSEVTSEKGKYIGSSTKFEEKSIFGFIENVEAKDAEILICDDMGTEWGDFISATEDEIIFYHAKHNKKGLSASNLEEVFGQAQKNLGSLELNDELINIRKDKWLRKYKNSRITTKIQRIRKSPAGADKIQIIKDYINNTSSNPRVKRKVYVVINFISKKKLEDGILKLKNGDDFQNKGVMLQILWYVNSLMSISLERNADFRIICQP